MLALPPIRFSQGQGPDHFASQVQLFQIQPSHHVALF